MTVLRFATSVIFITCFCATEGLSFAQDDSPQPSLRCGPNALLMFLELCDVSVQDEDLDAIPHNEDGVSLLQLYQAALASGADVAMRQFAVEDFESVPLPALVHAPGGRGHNHYYVWYKRTKEATYALDGTTADSLRMRAEKLPEFWTGYTIVPRKRWWRALNILDVDAWPLWAVLNVALLLSVFKAAAISRRLAVCVIVMPLTAGLGVLPATASTDLTEHVNGSWRDAEHGGLNALYIQLSLCGYTGKYEELLESVAGSLPNTLADLEGLARKCGYPLLALQLTPDELQRIELPLIIHLDGEELGEGAYIIVTRRFPTDVEIVNGATAGVSYMPYEDLYRQWSGIGLVIPPSSMGLPWVVAGVSAGSFAAFLYHFVRSIRVRRLSF